ncbi:hypothetical protein C475_15233 [Halosimplex carlsbadense 2-9-1]|uniref:Envelope protein N-terminal domain-containing protein n=1 Tax=Halosimplex carlsbadense 2-9-1 TaxID=797114 RepID=M0CK72_9EURY|nr:hypothetical protein C475_15233 [Halosimplex carlsbadense 2-9-1]
MAALLLVTSALGGAATTGMVDLDDDGPIGEANAFACAGACLIGAAAAAGIAIGTVSGAAAHAHFFSDSGSINETALAQADALEARKNMYDKAATQRQNSQILMDSYGNFLQDTREPATMAGKNAYIRALENGSSEAVARAKAREAVSNYYSAKQMQLRAQFNTSLLTMVSIEGVEAQHANISDSFASLDYNTDGNTNLDNANFSKTSTVTLVNGSIVPTRSIKLYLSNDAGNFDFTGHVTPSNDRVKDTYWLEVDSYTVSAPNENFDDRTVLPTQKYQNYWSDIEAQNDVVQSRVSDFVNSTYSKYQEGEIDTDDLVDPYLEARSYSPEGEEYDTWAISSLSAMGVGVPENMTTTRSMVIRSPPSDGPTYDGVLMSDELPVNGRFKLNHTYNATKLAGPQYVVSGETGSTTELEGEFRIVKVTDVNGKTLNTSEISYRDIDYNATDMDEFIALQKEVRNLTAELEARQSNLRDGGSSGGLFPNFGGGNIPMPAAVAVVVVLVGFVAIPALYRP